MVLIAAAVCSKSGKSIISRQFVEMTKSRIEGLLAAFPKLMTVGKQHTFVETDSVRYTYFKKNIKIRCCCFPSRVKVLDLLNNVTNGLFVYVLQSINKEGQYYKQG